MTKPDPLQDVYLVMREEYDINGKLTNRYVQSLHTDPKIADSLCNQTKVNIQKLIERKEAAVYVEKRLMVY